MYAIIEPKWGPEKLGGGYSPPGNRRTPHSDGVRRVACHSYIEACDDPFGADAPFQFHLGVRYPEGLPEQTLRLQTEAILDKLPASVKVVSLSYDGSTPIALLGAELPFAAIEGAGNDARDTFLAPNTLENPSLANIRAAIAADKALFVAGYNVVKAADGVFARAGGSTGCIGDGYSEGCIWAPAALSYSDPHGPGYIVDLGGTSASAPHVASALASVLAIFPETTPQNLVRLAKACAIPTPSLPGGVGRADFACMTTMDENGQWRVVSSEEFAGLIAPNRMHAMVFPGDARVTGTFAPRSGKPVELGTRVQGAFGFSAGVPGGVPGFLLDQKPGIYPLVGGDPKNLAVGGAIILSDGFFATVAVGDRSKFFGLGEEHRYTGTRALDAEFGHKYLYARLSRQWSSAAPLINSVRGDALGLTAEYTFAVTPRTTLTTAGHLDRFVRGNADTVFGAVTIDGTSWNKELAMSLDHALSDSETLSLSANSHWLERGDTAMGVAVGYRLKF